MPEAAIRKRKKRPVWYNVNLLSLPFPGLVSIFHRVSGLVLFLLAFWLLYLLDASLESAEEFARFHQIVAQPLARLVLLGALWAYLHHLCAGIRYLLLDLDVGVSLAPARASSFAVAAVSLTLTAVLGVALLW